MNINIHKAARDYLRGIITKKEFYTIRAQNANKKHPTIWMCDGIQNICVIEDCFNTRPLILLVELHKQDKLDGVNPAFYYIA